MEKLGRSAVLLLMAGLLLGAVWYGFGKPEDTTARTYELDSLSSLGSETSEGTPENSSAVAPEASKVDSVEILLNGLIQRLEKEPDDVSGWVLLGKSYHHLGRWDEATAAFDRAKELGYTGVPPALDDIPQQKTVARSRKSSLFASVDTRLVYKELARLSETKKTEVQPAASESRLSLLVNLSPSLLSKVPPQTSVFIFARSADREGPAAPLAVTRRALEDFPIEVSLDDSMAMVPGQTISSATNIIVGARIALSGSPVAKPGDPEILSAPVLSTHDELIELTILDLPGAQF